MSLEAEIVKLTAALEANTAAHAGGGGAPAKKPAAGGKKPAASGKKPAPKKGPTADDVAAAFGEYMKTGDKEERVESRANVKAIIDAMDTDRLTNLDPDRFQEALDYLDQFKAGEDPFEGGEGGDDGDDLM